MKESEFLEELQKRARAQELIIKRMPFPKIFEAASVWLGNHPWRYLIPLAFLFTLLLRKFFGPSYTDFILALFRGVL
ncbi:MAG: hypothetical protein AAB675_00080 [Patescibacteria group bacterium]